MNDFMYASGGLYIMGNHYLWNQSMTRLFSTDKIYVMRPIKDKRVQNGPLFKLCTADDLLFAARAGSEREDWSASVTIISDATHSKIFGRVQSGANIVNILIVTLNLTILDETWEEIKYGTKSKRVAFVTVSHIFANLA